MRHLHVPILLAVVVSTLGCHALDRARACEFVEIRVESHPEGGGFTRARNVSANRTCVSWAGSARGYGAPAQPDAKMC